MVHRQTNSLSSCLFLYIHVIYFGYCLYLHLILSSVYSWVSVHFVYPVHFTKRATLLYCVNPWVQNLCFTSSEYFTFIYIANPLHDCYRICFAIAEPFREYEYSYCLSWAFPLMLDLYACCHSWTFPLMLDLYCYTRSSPWLRHMY